MEKCIEQDRLHKVIDGVTFYHHKNGETLLQTQFTPSFKDNIEY